MVELKDHQQQEMEGKLLSLTPDVDGMHVHIFESSQLEGSYVGDLLYMNFMWCKKLELISLLLVIVGWGKGRWGRTWQVHWTTDS